MEIFFFILTDLSQLALSCLLLITNYLKYLDLLQFVVNSKNPFLSTILTEYKRKIKLSI